MQSVHYPYKVAAVYPDTETAVDAVNALDAAALGDVRVFRLAQDAADDLDLSVEPEPGETGETTGRDTAAGSGVGAVAAGAAAIAKPALFLSAPVIGPLIVLGYGALIGGVAGAVHGLRLHEKRLADLVKDALQAGCHVVIVHAPDRETELRVRNAIGGTMAEKTVYG